MLLFAVPASPLAQPWSILGGNIISALVGLTIARLVPDTTLAAAIAVGAAIVIMSMLRCLHPPGGAVALSTVLGSAGGHILPYDYALIPVGLNSLLLVMAGLIFHRIFGHSYPHVAPVAPNVHATRDPAPINRTGVNFVDLDAALAHYGDTLDVSPEDLRALFKEAETRAAERMVSPLRCAAIMSRDIVSVQADAPVARAREQLQTRRLHSLPVLDDDGRVVGTISHLELLRAGALAQDIASPAETARPETPVAQLLPLLADGRRHQIPIINTQQQLCGIVTQTDIIAALATGQLPQAPAASSSAISSGPSSSSSAGISSAS